jgi:hypothetical protein
VSGALVRCRPDYLRQNPLRIIQNDGQVNDRQITITMSAMDTEVTPLIPPGPKRITPLPKFQLSLICLIRLTEPICFLCVLPFINQMLLDVGAAKNPEAVGYSAGIVSFPAALSLC